MKFSTKLQKLAHLIKTSAEFPREISPMLATLTKEIPKGEQWVYETKYDGYRIFLKINQNEIKLVTRENEDWTHKFPIIVQEAQKLKVNSAILDGEMVMEEQGVSIFQELQNLAKTGDDTNLFYYAFDILYLNGKDLTDLPLIKRKEILNNVIQTIQSKKIKVADFKIGAPQTIFAKACEKGLEGIMAKDAQSLYVGKRSKSWLKLKCMKRQEFVIGGYELVKSEEKHGLGALLLGVYDTKGRLIYVGKTGTGFSDQLRISLEQKLKQIKQNISPFMANIKKLPKKAIWVHPKLVAEASFVEWTQDGLLRQAVFKGLREDKNPKLIRRET